MRRIELLSEEMIKDERMESAADNKLSPAPLELQQRSN